MTPLPTRKTSRPVTRRRCVTCGGPVVARRADVRYCSGRCRQRANRARAVAPELDAAIEAARRHYWDLIRLQAEARGCLVSQVLTDKAVHVDEAGVVYGGGNPARPGPVLGTTTPRRPGWASWGLEAAGPPFNPPPAAGPVDVKARQARKAARALAEEAR